MRFDRSTVSPLLRELQLENPSATHVQSAERGAAELRFQTAIPATLVKLTESVDVSLKLGEELGGDLVLRREIGVDLQRRDLRAQVDVEILVLLVRALGLSGEPFHLRHKGR